MEFKKAKLDNDKLHKVKYLVAEYDDAFALQGSELGRTPLVEHMIDIGSSLPINKRARRESFALRDSVAQIVDEMLKRGIANHRTVRRLFLSS